MSTDRGHRRHINPATAATPTESVAAVFLGPGFIDGQCPAVVLLAVEGGDCRLGRPLATV